MISRNAKEVLDPKFGGEGVALGARRENTRLRAETVVKRKLWR